MNIAMLNWGAFDFMSGVKMYIVNLAQNLADRGHQVYIITSNNVLPSYHRSDITFLTIDNDEYSERGFANYFRYCVKMVDKFSIDVLHTHCNIGYIVSNKIKQIRKTPYFISFHGYEYRFMDESLLNYKKALSNADYMFFQSLEIAENINSILDLKIDDRYVYMPNAVNLNEGTQCSSIVDRKIILFVGRLVKEKGLVYLFEAIKNLREEKDIELHVVGSGTLRDWCDTYIEENNLSDCIRMIGELPHTETTQKMIESYMVVIPSLYESMSTVLLEAMAAGKPIIASNAYGVTTVIENMKNGIIVQKENSSVIAKGIKMLLNDNRLCELLGKNARDKIKRDFSWEIIAGRIEEYYVKALNKGVPN